MEHTKELFDIELKRLAEEVKGWSSCNIAWSITDDNDPEYLTAAVGAIGEDGGKYPVAVVDCENYFAGSDSPKLASYYAAANPNAILELINQRDQLQSDIATIEQESRQMRARMERLEMERDELMEALKNAVDDEPNACFAANAKIIIFKVEGGM